METTFLKQHARQSLMYEAIIAPPHHDNDGSGQAGTNVGAPVVAAKKEA